MLIECDSCQVRGQACGDCVVSVLLQPGAASAVLKTTITVPGASWSDLDDEERRALDVLAELGMVPPLRLTPPAERAS